MKPIIFSIKMVQAIQEERKTETRRVVKPQPVMDESGMWHWKDCQWMDGGIGFPVSGIKDHARFQYGDVLWVRETWGIGIQMAGGVIYRADYESTPPLADGEHWRSSIYMPRKLARIYLQVAYIRMEQLHSITNEAALKEGIPDEWPMDEVYCPICKGEGLIGAVHPISFGFMKVECPHCDKPTQRFKNLWNSLNAKRGYGWEANPWVWVIKFERISKETALSGGGGDG